MTQADSVHSTPPLNTPIIGGTSRRNFLITAAGVAAGGTALALATVAPAAVAAPAASLPSLGDDFPAMVPAVEALEVAISRLKQASASYFEIDARLEEWSRMHPMPHGHRKVQRWSRWAHKVRAESGVYDAIDAQNAALSAVHKAMQAVAAIVPQNSAQLTVKAALAVTFEDRHPTLISRALAIDTVRLVGMRANLLSADAVAN
jgi:hypothetical protein